MTSASALQRDPFEGTAWRAIELLGEGAQGSLYRVQHRETGRQCAAKLLREHVAADRRSFDRMRLEAQALGRLEHPHIVAVLALSRTLDGRPFLVTELLQGVSLSEELSRRPRGLPLLEAIAYGWQLCSALDAAHRIGVVHRDIEPRHLFLWDRPGGGRLLEVLGFGVARVLPGFSEAPAPLAVPTEEGRFVGTAHHASPELLRGAPADARSDIYAAALVLYRMLVGRGPFDDAGSEAALLEARRREDVVPPSHWAETPIPAELDRLVLRALAPDPEARFQTAGELCDALEAIGLALSGPVGWAETLAFDVKADGSTAAGDSRHAVNVSARAQSGVQKKAAEVPGGFQPAAQPRLLPRWLLLLIFVAIVLLFALVVVGVLQLVEQGLVSHAGPRSGSF